MWAGTLHTQQEMHSGIPGAAQSADQQQGNACSANSCRPAVMHVSTQHYEQNLLMHLQQCCCHIITAFWLAHSGESNITLE
jgi:hypothetical protein